MSTPDRVCLAVSLILSAVVSGCTGTETDSPGLGMPVTEAQLAGFDLIADSRGEGLPPGSGNAETGETVYQNNCLACHGERGAGLSAATVLVGGEMRSEGPPLKTVGSYWPYATTLFDFIRRAMPADAPKSLSDDEVYAVTAYVLYINDIVARTETLDSQRLTSIQMPNRDGFIDQSQVR